MWYNLAYGARVFNLESVWVYIRLSEGGGGPQAREDFFELDVMSMLSPACAPTQLP